MASSVALKLVCALFVCMAVAAPHVEAAITCSAVTKSVTPCMSYLRNGGTVPSSCCAGVRTLNTMAGSPADRKTACGCLKSVSQSVSGINSSLAAGLPGKCDVSIPYKISPSTDCSRVS